MQNKDRKVSDWVDGWVTLNDRSEPVIRYHRWVAISLIAAALERKCRLLWGSLTFYPNMYIVLVGPSGARKGTAMGPALEMLDAVKVQMAAQATTREALIRALSRCNDTSVDTDDMYFEAHSSLTVYSPELTSFLGFNNLQLMSDLCDWYDCRARWNYETKSQGIDEIVGVYVNILGATTPDLIKSSMPMDYIGSGLTARIIFVFASHRRKKEPCPFLNKDELQLRQDLIHDLGRIKALRGDFKVSRRFTERWFAWYMDSPDDCPFDPQRFTGYWNRRPAHTMKLSMILSASRSSEMVIRLCDLERAVKIITNEEKYMHRTFSGVGKGDLADIISSVMVFIGKQKTVTFKQVLQHFYRDINGEDELEKIMQVLTTMGFVDKIDKVGSGEVIYEHKPMDKK